MDSNEQMDRLDTAACLLYSARGTIQAMDALRTATAGTQEYEGVDRMLSSNLDEQVQHALNQIRTVRKDLEDTATTKQSLMVMSILPITMSGITALIVTLASSLVFNLPPEASTRLGLSTGMFVLIASVIMLVSLEWMREES